MKFKKQSEFVQPEMETMRKEDNKVRNLFSEKYLNRMQRELIDSFSHEIRSSFTIIIGYCQLAMQDKTGKVSKKEKDFFYEILVNAERLNGLLTRKFEVEKFDLIKKNIQLVKENQ